MFDFQLIIDSLPLLFQGACVTVQITAISVGLGLFFGLFIGIAQISRVAFFRVPAKIYVDFLRGTPLLVQIFMIYFALPLLIGTRIDPFIAAIVACSINSSAYIAEIFRAGIQSIDKGQMEAGRSLGLNWSQTMRFIIIPQAFKRIIPPLGNGFYPVHVEGLFFHIRGWFQEVTRQGQLVIASTYGAMEIWTAVALIYLLMTMPITRLVAYLEKRFKSNDRN